MTSLPLTSGPVINPAIVQNTCGAGALCNPWLPKGIYIGSVCVLLIVACVALSSAKSPGVKYGGFAFFIVAVLGLLAGSIIMGVQANKSSGCKVVSANSSASNIVGSPHGNNVGLAAAGPRPAFSSGVARSPSKKVTTWASGPPDVRVFDKQAAPSEVSTASPPPPQRGTDPFDAAFDGAIAAPQQEEQQVPFWQTQPTPMDRRAADATFYADRPDTPALQRERRILELQDATQMLLPLDPELNVPIP